MRHLGRGVSPAGLYMALAPFAFARAAFSLNRRFPEYFGEPPSPLNAWRSRMNCLLGHCLDFIPDRLAAPKWQARFQTEGLEHIQEARQKKRRVILVFFHVGAFKLIPILLRVLGIPVTVLVEGESESRSSAKRMKDKLSPFSPLPAVLYTEDQLRSAVEVVRADQCFSWRRTARQANRSLFQLMNIGRSKCHRRRAAMNSSRTDLNS